MPSQSHGILEVNRQTTFAIAPSDDVALRCVTASVARWESDERLRTYISVRLHTLALSSVRVQRYCVCVDRKAVTVQRSVVSAAVVAYSASKSHSSAGVYKCTISGVRGTDFAGTVAL